MWLDTPTFTSTEKTPTPQEIFLSPEEKNKQILQEVLRIYWVDLKDYSFDLETLNTNLRTQLSETTQEEFLLEQQAKKLYELYIKEELWKGNWIEKTANLDNLTDSINSQRISDIKEEFEKVINPVLDKYDFLDERTKNFIKLWFVNSLLKSPMSQIWDSLMWWVADFVWKLQQMDSGDISSMVDAFNKDPKDSWRSLAFEDQFIESLKSYTDKFDKIKEKLEELETDPKLTDKQQQNIISHIDWFRDPALIEAGVDWLDISKLNIENKDIKNDEIDLEKLSKYMINSREKIFELSKKLNLWDKVGDNLYNIINSWWTIGEWVQKIAEFILNIPFIWKFLAIFLWLNPDRAIEELRENSKNFKILSIFKSLWITKDKEWKQKEWVEPFQNIDLSQINFNSSKKEINSLKPFIKDESDEKIQEFWLQAFWEWVEKDWIKLEFRMEDNQKFDKKITSLEFGEIIKTGLDKYNADVWKERVKEEDEKREGKKGKIDQNLTNLTNEIARFKTSIETISLQINTIDSILAKNYEKIEHWDDILNIWDINNIKTQDIINHNWENFWDIIWNIIWKNDYDKDLSENDKKTLNQMFIFIKDYCTENKLSSQWELKDFLKNNETWFNEWLIEKKNKLDEEKTWKEKEKSTLTWNLEKYNFAEKIWDKLTAITSETKLSNWIETWEWENKTIIKLENNKLHIWEDRFKMSWIDEIITDIVIDWSDRVKFEWRRGFFSWEKNLPKADFINWFKELVLNWSHNFTTPEWKNIKVEKV